MQFSRYWNIVCNKLSCTNEHTATHALIFHRNGTSDLSLIGDVMCLDLFTRRVDYESLLLYATVILKEEKYDGCNFFLNICH